MQITDIFPALLNQHVQGTSRRPSATKRGPGRRHEPGHQRATPQKTKGAPVGFAQHQHPRKNELRRHTAQVGARQFRKAVKALRRADRAAAAAEVQS